MEAVLQRMERLARDGIFGPGDVVRVVPNSEVGKGAQYASQLFFIRVDLKNDGVTEVPAVVKVQVSNDTRDFMGTDIQFANEVTMYDKILPELQSTGLGISCKMLYGLATVGEDPQQDIVILEDLRPFGYKVSKSVFLDSSHVSLTLRKLGEYHGLSYKLKKLSPTRLKDLGKLLIPPKYIDGGPFFEGALLRGFKSVIDEIPNSIAKEAYKKLTSVPSSELYRILKIPEEPFAVIAHGDLNVNNLLFAYKNEELAEVKFIDFATAMYTSPAVDIAFFLYMNTSQDTREENWDEFLKTYWDGVTSVEKDPGFVFEEFLEHFGKRAVWGYVPSSFFLPMMLCPEVSLPPEDFLKLTDEEKRTWGLETGDARGTEATSNIVRHLLERGYLEQFLNDFDFTLGSV